MKVINWWVEYSFWHFRYGVDSTILRWLEKSKLWQILAVRSVTRLSSQASPEKEHFRLSILFDELSINYWLFVLPMCINKVYNMILDAGVLKLEHRWRNNKKYQRKRKQHHLRFWWHVNENKCLPSSNLILWALSLPEHGNFSGLVSCMRWLSSC